MLLATKNKIKQYFHLIIVELTDYHVEMNLGLRKSQLPLSNCQKLNIVKK